jgi:hypothetical protein
MIGQQASHFPFLNSTVHDFSLLNLHLDLQVDKILFYPITKPPERLLGYKLRRPSANTTSRFANVPCLVAVNLTRRPLLETRLLPLHHFASKKLY